MKDDFFSRINELKTRLMSSQSEIGRLNHQLKQLKHCKDLMKKILQIKEINITNEEDVDKIFENWVEKELESNKKNIQDSKNYFFIMI